MKIICSIITILFLFACTSNNSEVTEEKDNDSGAVTAIDSSNILYQLSGQWILVKRTNADGSKSVNYSLETPSIVTHFENNGYFSIYDMIKTNASEKEKMEKRSSGQWEVYNDDELVLRYSLTDSNNVESYVIQTIDDKSLVLKNSEKDIIDSYQRK
ncbi:MAG: hypothetical protein M9897_10845 [Brumimicrobium sp.]|nr:hypothetical protein [Brumimicrobium sp.]